MKKVLSILLALVMVFSTMPLSAFADEPLFGEQDSFILDANCWMPANEDYGELTFADVAPILERYDITSKAVLSINAISPTSIKRYTVLVLDTTGEQRFITKNGTITVGASLTKVKQAACKFVEKVITASGDNYVAIVSFDETAVINSGFSKDYVTLENAINNLQAGSGRRNANEAFKLTDKLLEKISDEGAIENVLYFSGLMPSWGSYSTSGRYSQQDFSWVWSDTYQYLYAYCNPVYATVQTLKEKGYNLYTLGCFTNLWDVPKNSSDRYSPYDFTTLVMKDIQNAGFYDTRNPDDLEFEFGEIADDIVSKRTGTFYYQSKNSSKDEVLLPP